MGQVFVVFNDDSWKTNWTMQDYPIPQGLGSAGSLKSGPGILLQCQPQVACG